jgi:hypothetical protein
MRGNALGSLAAEIMAVAVGILAVYLWVAAIAHDYKRNEPLLSLAWVACPPCGVVRGGYLLI